MPSVLMPPPPASQRMKLPYGCLTTLPSPPSPSQPPSGVPLNALVFDGPGGRLYTGDAAGCVTEYAVDLASQEPLKRLRISGELAGRPVVQLALHPGSHYLIALTRWEHGWVCDEGECVRVHMCICVYHGMRL